MQRKCNLYTSDQEDKTHHEVFSLANLKPGIFPTLLTIMLRVLLLVSMVTALLEAMFAILTLFTSMMLSPTHNPAESINKENKYSCCTSL